MRNTKKLRLKIYKHCKEVLISKQCYSFCSALSNWVDENIDNINDATKFTPNGDNIGDIYKEFQDKAIELYNKEIKDNLNNKLYIAEHDLHIISTYKDLLYEHRWSVMPTYWFNTRKERIEFITNIINKMENKA